MITFHVKNNDIALLTVAIGNWAFHFFPKHEIDCFWGFHDEPNGYDCYHFRDRGFGKFLLVCWWS